MSTSLLMRSTRLRLIYCLVKWKNKIGNLSHLRFPKNQAEVPSRNQLKKNLNGLMQKSIKFFVNYKNLDMKVR